MLLLSGAACSECVSLGVHDDYSLCKNGAHVTARSKSHALTMSKSLVGYLSHADDFFVVNGNISAREMAIYVRLPSRPSAAGEGYCGSGNEDYILLVDRTEDSLDLSDALLIQSCLKGTSLTSDQGDDPRQALKPASPPLLVTFDLIDAEGAIQPKGVVVEKGKLQLVRAND